MKTSRLLRSSPIRRIGLTLIELLVVLAIIGILMGLLIGAVMRVRESFNRMKCQNNLKQIGLAVHQFHDSFKILPYNISIEGEGFGANSHSWSWLSLLLPYIEHENIYREAGIPNKTLLQSKDQVALAIPIFLCPSDPTSARGPFRDAADLGLWFPPFIEAGYTNYKGVAGSNWEWGESQWHNAGPSGNPNSFTNGDGTFYRHDFNHRKSLAGILDGTSQTVIVGESMPDKSKWCAWAYSNTAIGTSAIDPNAKQADGKPFDPAVWQNSYGFFSNHSSGLNFAIADGSVRFVGDSIARTTYRAMATIAGGEIIALP